MSFILIDNTLININNINTIFISSDNRYIISLMNGVEIKTNKSYEEIDELIKNAKNIFL